MINTYKIILIKIEIRKNKVFYLLLYHTSTVTQTLKCPYRCICLKKFLSAKIMPRDLYFNIIISE